DTPDATLSTFSADPGAIIPDGTDSTTLTFTAQDSYGNPITGLTGLTFAATPATGATLSAVTEAGNGNYTATMTSTVAGSYQVVPRINGTAISGLSDTVTVAVVATDVQDILVNGYTFAKDAGFPKTGFVGAKFTVQLNGGEPTDYTWTSSAAWAPVDDSGVVSFTARGDGTPVNITATSKADASKAFTYTFTLKDWYINDGATERSHPSADTWCTSKSAQLASRSQLAGPKVSAGQSNTRGTAGALWSEWGSLIKYPGSGFSYGHAGYAWTRDSDGQGWYVVGIITGSVTGYAYSGYHSDSIVICRQGL
ncbi:TPA: Ig-like domain-containing protein, partial [Serratia marcescens]|nr:Ig-like domain-containing protein [Serratia marcescens]